MTAGAERKGGRLVLVATPIGNLGDMSSRAEETLRNVPVVMAEDTRRTARFVDDRRRLYSYNDHNAAGRLPQIVDFLSGGLDVALVSDAGMPGISDPAYRAVRTALENGYEVTAVPGPTAVTTALAVSGLPSDRFVFEGFLPAKKGARTSRLREMSLFTGSIVYYIGPHHLLKYLGEMREVMGNRSVCAAREMTKLHEEYRRGSIDEVAEYFGRCRVRGEVTLVVGAEALGPDFFN